jgi:lysophospholipase L1-like esterase
MNTLFGVAQDPARLLPEVMALQAKYDTIWDNQRETIVFTGSSSIRFWNNLPQLFPEKQIVNTGFGGSHTSDLLTYTEELIFRYRPRQVFIYEGDNDLNHDKKPRHILKDFDELIRGIMARNPETCIVVIAPKPSIARWHLKRRYRNLNRKLKRRCKNNELLEFADTWNVMLDGRRLRDELFIEDGLHMNSEGYQIWQNLIADFIN